MTETTHPISAPTEPGLYEPAVLGDIVTVRVDSGGAASVVIELAEAAYEAAILDFARYANEYGPFRRLGEGGGTPCASL